MTTPVRFALCGTGFIARLHAGAIAATPGTELVAVHNHRRETLAAFTADHPVPFATTDWEELVDLVRSGGVDVAVVATPNALHAA